MAVVYVYDNAYNDFKQIDWDFADSSNDSSAVIHPYPARFINEIPKELIRLLSRENNGVVFDPFCGSGTTLFEAKKAGLNSVGVDLNPIACLISRVRTSGVPETIIPISQEVVLNAQSKITSGINIPDIPNLDHWFKKDIQLAIAALLQQINLYDDSIISDALRLALSSIIVRMSNQESDTRYAAIENNHSIKDVFSNFTLSCKKMYELLSIITDNGTHSKIICNDILSINGNELGEKIELVITSPPYPNAYEYWLYHKYRMWWLGYDPIKVRTFEIGARPNYHKKNGQTAKDFEKQMFAVFDLFMPSLVSGGHVCFVIGRSIIKGVEIDNAELIQRVAMEHGLIVKVNIERAIAPTRKSFNLKYGKIKTENILVFRKEK